MADIGVAITVDLNENSAGYGTAKVVHTLDNTFLDTSSEHGVGLIDPNGKVIKAYDTSTPDGTGLTFEYTFDIKVNGSVLWGEYTFNGFLTPNGVAESRQTYSQVYDIGESVAINFYPEMGYDCFQRIVYGKDDTNYPESITPTVQWTLNYPAIAGQTPKADETISAGDWQRAITHEGVTYSGLFSSEFNIEETLLSQSRNSLVDQAFDTPINLNTSPQSILAFPGPSFGLTQNQLLYIEGFTISSAFPGTLDIDYKIGSSGFRSLAYPSFPAVQNDEAWQYTGADIAQGSFDIEATASTTLNGVTISPGNLKIYDSLSIEILGTKQYGYQKSIETKVICDLESEDLNAVIEPVFQDLLDAGDRKGGFSGLSATDQDKLMSLAMYQIRRLQYIIEKDSSKVSMYTELINKLLGASTSSDPKAISAPDIPVYTSIDQITQDWTTIQSSQLNPEFSGTTLQYQIWSNKIKFRGHVVVGTGKSQGSLQRVFSTEPSYGVTPSGAASAAFPVFWGSSASPTNILAHGSAYFNGSGQLVVYNEDRATSSPGIIIISGEVPLI